MAKASAATIETPRTDQPLLYRSAILKPMPMSQARCLRPLNRWKQTGQARPNLARKIRGIPNCMSWINCSHIGNVPNQKIYIIDSDLFCEYNYAH